MNNREFSMTTRLITANERIAALEASNQRLREALEDMIKRFHRCAEVVGNCPDYIDMATRDAREALEQK